MGRVEKSRVQDRTGEVKQMEEQVIRGKGEPSQRAEKKDDHNQDPSTYSFRPHLLHTTRKELVLTN